MGLVENRRQMAQLPIEVELENENEDDNVSANKRKYVMKRFNCVSCLTNRGYTAVCSVERDRL